MQRVPCKYQIPHYLFSAYFRHYSRFSLIYGRQLISSAYTTTVISNTMMILPEDWPDKLRWWKMYGVPRMHALTAALPILPMAGAEVDTYAIKLRLRTLIIDETLYIASSTCRAARYETDFRFWQFCHAKFPSQQASALSVLSLYSNWLPLKYFSQKLYVTILPGHLASLKIPIWLPATFQPPFEIELI